jgi:hypothetical protein
MDGDVLHYALYEITNIVWKAALVRINAPSNKFPQFQTGHGPEIKPVTSITYNSAVVYDSLKLISLSF